MANIKFRDFLNRLLVYVLPIAGGILGAMGGADNSSKAYRRFVIPGLLTTYAYSNTESLLTVGLMSMSFGMAMGYGIPDPGYPDDSNVDSGSDIGRFYYKLFNKNTLLANIFTRGTIALIIAVPLIIIPLLKHNWTVYGWCTLGIVLTNALISWRGFGMYRLFGKDFSWVETITWGLITLFSTIIIHVGGRLR